MRRGSSAVLAGAAAFAALALLATALPDAWHDRLFCRAPAALAAAYFRAALDGAAFTLGSGRVVEVTRACGGSDFFALLSGVLVWHAVRRQALALLPLWLAGAWLYTLAVNGLRLIATVWARAAAEQLLPERGFAAVHLVSGVLVFFPAFLLLWWAIVRQDSACPEKRSR